MQFKATQKVPENAVYLIIWLVIFIMPVLIATSNTGRLDKQVFVGWARMVPFVLIFIINTVWLLPELLFKGRTGAYLLAVVVLSFLLVLVWEYMMPIIREFLISDQVQRPNLRPLRPGLERPDFGNQLPHRPNQRVAGDNLPVRPRNHVLSIVNQMVIAWLVVGFNTALKVTNKWFKDEQKKKELEKESLRSELAFLQNQISPHFFMNTLNNIHAQIDIDTKQAQSSIVTLSKMMRYLLYESEKGTTTLKKEIEFLKSYVDLMKLRVDEEIDITLEISVQDEEIQIHPLLFISFVENAFKHGISYNEKSFIHIELKQDASVLEFSCLNSLSIQNKITNAYSGVGLDNIKKRLSLLYNNSYELVIEEKESSFVVNLKLPIHAN